MPATGAATTTEHEQRYQVLINQEEQYALFPEGLPAPRSWVPAGFSGTEDECIAHVDAHWADTRPLSLRRRQET
ncbi:Antibiotic synthesis protein MbtH (modular protein) [Frankia canadensis]|uniref:Antibiotic synthesis protein MbtH (Modular protein) n=1 Tax=Frankia canadensis TaxID=1836972 RepID=A0A2I2L288_9ACTN|nr:MbtH family NRPS accessory protein [Frankia canadensis]SNQ52015.1 Antibiotic synthesis protein MbtH (modular protein) [Frankia canadensis]SOU59305.1 Antibiotic synthesis protein MbtH (modular protein) [Frankia canadensis]